VTAKDVGPGAAGANADPADSAERDVVRVDTSIERVAAWLDRERRADPANHLLDLLALLGEPTLPPEGTDDRGRQR
jgi:hypothetical protein